MLLLWVCIQKTVKEEQNRRVNEVEQTQAGSGDAAFYRNYIMRLIILWYMGYLLMKEIQLIDIGRLTTV